MNATGLIAVGTGGAIGCWLRWWLGLKLNAVAPLLPLGTLTANLVGGYLIGLALGWFLQYPSLPPEYRLFLITGLLGGLTTFSTFSLEAVELLMGEQYGWAALHVTTHLAGSLLLTALGILTVRWLAAA